MPSIKEIMQMKDCVKLMKLRMKLEDAGRKSSAEYQVADALFEQMCEGAQNRGMDDEGNPLRPDDQDYGYTPPGGY